MLTFSAAALQQLRAPRGCRVAVQLVMSGGTDLTSRISSIGTVQSSMRPVARDVDLGVLSVVMRNDDDYFSYLKAGTALYGTSYLGERVQLFLGVWLPNGTREVASVFYGHLGYVEVDAEGRRATLKVNSVLEKLRSPGVGDLVDKTLHSDGVSAYEDAPAAMVYSIINGSRFAGIPTIWAPSPTFDAAARRERSARVIARGFKFQAGSWYDNCRRLLDHAGAMLLVDGQGRLIYSSVQPTLPAGTFQLVKGQNLKSLRHSQNYSDIKNKAAVRRLEGADLVATASSPLVDAASVTAYGARPPLDSMDFPLFTEDVPAELAAGVRLGAVSSPLGTFTAEAHIEAMAVEVGDFVRVTDESQGLLAKSLLCYSTVVNPDARTVQLGLMDSEITGKSWARLDEGQTLDSSRLWW